MIIWNVSSYVVRIGILGTKDVSCTYYEHRGEAYVVRTRKGRLKVKHIETSLGLLPTEDDLCRSSEVLWSCYGVSYGGDLNSIKGSMRSPRKS